MCKNSQKKSLRVCLWAKNNLWLLITYKLLLYEHNFFLCHTLSCILPLLYCTPHRKFAHAHTHATWKQFLIMPSLLCKGKKCCRNVGRTVWDLGQRNCNKIKMKYFCGKFIFWLVGGNFIMRMSVLRRIRSSLCGGHQGRKVNFFSNNTYVVCTNYLCAWKTLDFLSLLSLLKLDKCSVVVEWGGRIGKWCGLRWTQLERQRNFNVTNNFKSNHFIR